jgi:dienelactone hydrolase
MKTTALALSRRRAILAIIGVATPKPGWCQDHTSSEVSKPYGWTEDLFQGRKVYHRGPAGKTVVLLHEINGLSPGCVDFGMELAQSGFSVYMPLLFGHATQDSVFLGTIESCVFGGFRCSEAGGSKDTGPVRWVSDFVSHLEASNDPIGVIGMCQSGAYPLATMKEGGKVRAVVLSQPSLPLANDKQRDVGISPATMNAARKAVFRSFASVSARTRSPLPIGLSFCRNTLAPRSSMGTNSMAPWASRPHLPTACMLF